MPEGFYWGQAEYHKEKNSKALQGKLNPMYGKSGELHPAYGYKHSNEMIQHLSRSKQGNKNPMYDKLPKTLVNDQNVKDVYLGKDFYL